MSYFCPVCKSELIWGGQAQYQMLDEHVSHPNAESPVRSFYYCDNHKCDANAPQNCRTRTVITEKFKKTEPNSVVIFWDEYGDLYGWSSDIKFIDGNNAPFGSLSRQMHIEIDKKDENFAFLTAFRIQLRIEYSYKSDKDGNILKRKGHLRIWKKDGRLGGYTLVIGTWRMLMFYRKKFRKDIDNFRKNRSRFAARNLENMFRPEYKTSASSKIFSAYLKIFYPILSRRLKDKDL